MDLALALRMIANTSNHVINYYDRYTFPGNVFGSPGADASSQVKGLPTAVKVSVLGTTTMLLSVNYYDNQGRLVRTNSQNHLGGTDVINNEYSFVGEITKSTRTHTANGSITIVITDYEYDHAGRLIDTWKKVGSSPRVLVSRYEYNQLGQVRSKKLHGNSVGNTFAQTINYEYNPHGWLKQSASDLFTQTLNYEDGASPQYNGNISLQVWTHADAADQSYSYTYDKLNRLIEGKMPGDIGKEALTYDKMGNILTLSRTGTSATVRDALSYTYTGHRLTKVVDGSTDATLQHHLTGTTNYTYDVNGNMESRLNTAQPGNNITDINYNHLNLPTNITATGGILTYVYDATGRKLRSTQATITTDYIDGIEWVDNTLNLLHMEEGRITKSGPNYIDEYLLKDHLGNNRSGFKAATPSTASFRSDYYPFGLQYQENIVVGSPENRYLYNGKEAQKGTGMLDYGARQYDPLIRRWNVIDPLAEAYDRFSPYNYGMNDPIGKLDPNGMWVTTVNGYRTEDPDEIARLMLEIEQKELDNDEKKEAEKERKKAEKAKKERGVILQFFYDTPVVGNGLSSGDKLVAGDLMGASADLFTAFAEMFTLGAGAGLTSLADDFIGILSKNAAKGGSQFLLKPGAANLTQKGLDHIIARHWSTSGAKGAGKFAEGTTGASLKSMVQTTTTQGVFRANTAGRAVTIAEYNFGRVIGTTSSGAPASNLRVVTGADGKVITAFPF